MSKVHELTRLLRDVPCAYTVPITLGQDALRRLLGSYEAEGAKFKPVAADGRDGITFYVMKDGVPNGFEGVAQRIALGAEGNRRAISHLVDAQIFDQLAAEGARLSKKMAYQLN